MTQQYNIFLCVVIIVTTVLGFAAATTGAIELDEINFDKITKKFAATLVKFDVAFPYGDKHDAFIELAKETKDVDDLLVAHVGVKDYGEKENEALAVRYAASKDNFPVVKLLVQGSEPVTFDDSKGFTTDELKRFVRNKLKHIHLTLPGCVAELDKLAVKFMKAKKNERKDYLKIAETLLKDLKEKEADSGKIYTKIMEKVEKDGDEFINTETERLKKILNGKISNKKKDEINTKLNILQSFETTVSSQPKEDL